MRTSRIFSLIQNLCILIGFVFANSNAGTIFFIFVITNVIPIFPLMYRFSRLLKHNEYAQRYVRKMGISVSHIKTPWELFTKLFLILIVEMLLIVILFSPDIIQILVVLLSVIILEVLKYFLTAQHLPDPTSPLDLTEFSKIFLNPITRFYILVLFPTIFIIIFGTFLAKPVTGFVLMSIKILFDWFNTEDLFLKLYNHK